MADKRISQLIERTDIANNDVLPIVASGATTTNKVTISTIQEWMQDNLDLGVTSVGITIGSTGTDVNVSGSPITTSGNITINIPTASATNRGLLSSTDWSTFNNKLSSVGLTMPSAFTVSNSPLTANGTIAVTGAGTVAQYIRGDGSLADFPEAGGGGASVSYYLNGSVSQGTIGGIAYLEMSKTPILGAGTNFTINANGYIASFITDAGDPNLLLIPGGNWNFETYFAASSGGGTPSFYVELYKVSGSTATLVASNSANPELIAFGTTTTAYFSSLAVPATTLTLTDRLALRYYVTHAGRTITLHTENSNLCQVITTFTTGLTALNGLTAQVQNFATGTSGTDFGISSTGSTHTFNLPTASATNRGALSSADWATFNGKQNSITLTTSGTSGAATLVGSTLNIPNYSTGVANAYVPYVGAIGSVTLGYNALSASQINIDGNSPTSGSYLGFKHSTSVNSGTDGYTSIYTFGTNTIGFQSTSGGAIKTFSFSMVGITAGVPGGRVYTLPDASGTLALTSDLSGYLPLTGGTLTGALNGNSASFTGNVGVGISTTANTGNLQIGGSANTSLFTQQGTDTVRIGVRASGRTGISIDSSNTTFTNRMWYLDNNGASGSLEIGRPGLGVLTLANTGAATFSSSVQTGGNIVIRTGGYPLIDLGVSDSNYFRFVYDNPNGTLVLSKDGGASLLSIASTGAATFSSSVTATANASGRSGLFGGSSFGLRIDNAGSFNNGGTTLHGVDNTFVASYQKLSLNGSSLEFMTDYNPRVTITNGGNVGIGTASPDSQLTLNGSSNSRLNMRAGDTRYGTLYADNGVFAVSSITAIPLVLGTNDTERMRISSSGNVGIGTVSPNSKLEVVDGTGCVFRAIGNGTNVMEIGNYKPTGSGGAGYQQLDIAGSILAFYTGTAGGGSAPERMRITSGGAVRIGSNTHALASNRRMTVQGDAGIEAVAIGTTGEPCVEMWQKHTSGDNVFSVFLTDSVSTTRGSIDYNRAAGLVRYNTTSDANLKNIIGDSDKSKSIEILNSTKIREYSWKDDEFEKPQIGVIAQELHETFKGAVSVGSDQEEFGTENYKPWAVDKTAFTFHLIAGWQEHQRIIQEQQEQIKSLTEQVQALKSQING